jgi:hypothetical protein
VAWIENDVVNNQMADYTESHRVQEKVDVLIFALDLILDIAFENILLKHDEGIDDKLPEVDPIQLQLKVEESLK